MSASRELAHLAHVVLTSHGPKATTAASAAVAARAATAARAGSAARAGKAAGTTSSRSIAAIKGKAGGKAGGKPLTRKVELRSGALGDQRRAWGDRSGTFAAPGQRWSDALSVAAPLTLARYSPIASSIAGDGAYLRAMFGSLAWLLPGLSFVTMASFGVATDGFRTPLPLWAFCAVLFAGLFDAGIGFTATIGALLACIALGSFFSLAGFTMVVMLAALWCGLPVMVGKVRVYLRDAPNDVASWYRRLGDITIGSLLCGYLGFKFIGILTGPNNSFAGIHSNAHDIGWWLVFATALKYLITTLASHGYPERMQTCTSDEVPTRSRHVELFSLVGRGTAAFVVFVAFLGFNWMVLTLLALYLIDVILPDVIKPTDAHPAVRFFVPQNLGKIFTLTLVSACATIALKSHVDSTYHLVIDALFIVMVVAIINNAAAARWSPRELNRPSILYIGGFALAALTILQLSDHLIKA